MMNQLLGSNLIIQSKKGFKSETATAVALKSGEPGAL